MRGVFEDAGLRAGSMDMLEYQVGMVIVSDHAADGACDYEFAVGELVEYLGV